MLSYSVSGTGYFKVKLLNYTEVARFVSHKAVLLQLTFVTDPVLICEFSDEGVQRIEPVLDSDEQIKRWMLLYPKLADDNRKFATSELAEKLLVCHSEIKWKVRFPEIPRLNQGVDYGLTNLSRTEVLSYLDELIQKGVIRELNTEERVFMSPCIFLRKIKGGIRKVLDLRLLNTYCDAWTTQMTGGVIAVLRSIPQEWDYFTVLDLSVGFANLPVCEALQTLFGFEFLSRRFTYVTLPQGFSCSSHLFHSRVKTVLTGTQSVSYLDDIIVGGVGRVQHDENLSRVLNILQSYGFMINFEKVVLCKQRITFLGFEVFPGGFSLRSYIQANIEKLPLSNSLRQLRRQIGLYNFVRPTVPRLDQLLSPLYDQLKLDAPSRMKVSQLHELCRQIWKTILEESVILRRLDLATEHSFGILCDWSTTGMGFLLFSGSPEEGELITVQSKSETLTVSSHVGELLSIHWALKEIQDLTAGQRVTLYTDSSSVVNKLLTPSTGQGVKDLRLLRALSWIFVNYPVGVRLFPRHLPGVYNQYADLLSRANAEVQINVLEPIQEENMFTEIQRIHREGHWGVYKTIIRLKQRNMPYSRVLVQRVVRECRTCALFRYKTYSDILGEPPFGLTPGYAVYLDVVGPLPRGRSNLRFIVNLVDSCTRFAQSTARQYISSEAVILSLEEWLRDRKKPLVTLVTDNATYLKSNLMRQWCEAHSVEHIYCAPHVHKSIGMVERYNCTLIDRLRKVRYDRGGSWSDHLRHCVREYNTMEHSVTKYVPEQLWEMSDIEWQMSKQRTKKARDAVNARLKRKQTDYQIGQLILLWDAEKEKQFDQKFDVRWRGPYVIISRLTTTLWKVVKVNEDNSLQDGEESVAHSDIMQPYV